MTDLALLFAPGPFGGVEKLIIDSAKDFEAELILIKETRNSKPFEDFILIAKQHHIKFTIFNSTQRYDKELIASLNKFLKKRQITLVHSHGMKANFINSFLHTQTIATQHGQTSINLKTRILEFIESFRLNKIDTLVCVSEEMFHKSKHKNKVLIENYIPHLTESCMTPSTERPFTVSFAGRLSKEKGILFLAEHIKLPKNAKLNIYGAGIEEEKLKDLIKEKQSINYMGFSSDIKLVLSQTDLFIIPSKREGLPIIALEAISFGVPILATRVGGLPKLLQSDTFLFQSNKATEMNEKLAYICEHYEQVHEEYKIVRAKALENYSKEKWIKLLKHLYFKKS